MKNVDFYKERATMLLKEFTSAYELGLAKEKSIPVSDNLVNLIQEVQEEFSVEIPKITMDFIHLVYSYDPNLPLNQYIQSLSEIKFVSPLFDYNGSNQKKYESIKEYIEYFIKYLTEYA